MSHESQDKDRTGRYEIRVRGHLSPRWSEALADLDLTAEAGGTTLIHGVITDQAALHAILRQIRDLGLELLSLTRAPPGTSQADDDPSASLDKTGDLQ